MRIKLSGGKTQLRNKLTSRGKKSKYHFIDSIEEHNYRMHHMFGVLESLMKEFDIESTVVSMASRLTIPKDMKPEECKYTTSSSSGYVFLLDKYIVVMNIPGSNSSISTPPYKFVYIFDSPYDALKEWRETINVGNFHSNVLKDCHEYFRLFKESIYEVGKAITGATNIKVEELYKYYVRHYHFLYPIVKLGVNRSTNRLINYMKDRYERHNKDYNLSEILDHYSDKINDKLEKAEDSSNKMQEAIENVVTGYPYDEAMEYYHDYLTPKDLFRLDSTEWNDHFKKVLSSGDVFEGFREEISCRYFDLLSDMDTDTKDEKVFESKSSQSIETKYVDKAKKVGLKFIGKATKVLSDVITLVIEEDKATVKTENEPLVTPVGDIRVTEDSIHEKSKNFMNKSYDYMVEHLDYVKMPIAGEFYWYPVFDPSSRSMTVARYKLAPNPYSFNDKREAEKLVDFMNEEFYNN